MAIRAADPVADCPRTHAIAPKTPLELGRRRGQSRPMHRAPTIALAAALATSLAAPFAASPARAEGIGTAAISAALAKMAPHRVIYALEPETLGTHIGPHDARGAMAFELAETCQAWESKHIFRVNLVLPEKEARSIRSDFFGAESKDGLTFRFTTKSMLDGRVTETTEGRAAMPRHGVPGKADLTAPKPASVELPADTAYPIWHNAVVVAAAAAGEKTVWRPLFDGSGAGKISVVNAVIVAPVPAPAEGHALLRRPGWRLTMTFFDKTPDGAPTQIMDAVMLDNGVIAEFTFKSRDFTLRSRIVTIEPLPKPRC
jgi:hypothetical protein